MIFLFMLHEAPLRDDPLQVLLSSLAVFEACGQTSKPQKSFARAFQKAQEAFCLSSPLPSPLMRGAITKIFFLEQGKKKKRKKNRREKKA